MHYLWPALIVVLTPVFSSQKRLRSNHIVGAACGLVGAAVAALHGVSISNARFEIGYVFAIVAAFVWASYSLLLGTLKSYSAWTTGGVCIISGILSLICHYALEGQVQISNHDWILIVCQGLGPMGMAFYLWDFGMRHGDTRILGVLAYTIPVLSTVVLSIVTGREITVSIAIATSLVILGGILGLMSRSDPRHAPIAEL
ncbi:hypothetical protein GCM10011396_23590 [Undibacterium terreum]|uniref:EamA domain-containing protein n=1 Tax=Undibacterium terreum TaxID=1224302 RepID=A0A916ULM6_9BURK|nr:hypothetical protein GCM10011396_23590 [Undibacterium terreum]